MLPGIKKELKQEKRNEINKKATVGTSISQPTTVIDLTNLSDSNGSEIQQSYNKRKRPIQNDYEDEDSAISVHDTCSDDDSSIVHSEIMETNSSSAMIMVNKGVQLAKRFKRTTIQIEVNITYIFSNLH